MWSCCSYSIVDLAGRIVSFENQSSYLWHIMKKQNFVSKLRVYALGLTWRAARGVMMAVKKTENRYAEIFLTKELGNKFSQKFQMWWQLTTARPSGIRFFSSSTWCTGRSSGRRTVRSSCTRCTGRSSGRRTVCPSGTEVAGRHTWTFIFTRWATYWRAWD